MNMINYAFSHISYEDSEPDASAAEFITAPGAKYIPDFSHCCTNAVYCVFVPISLESFLFLAKCAFSS